MTPYSRTFASALVAAALAVAPVSGGASDAGPSIVRIEPTAEGGYRLLRNGEPFVVRGAGGGRVRLDEFVGRGGNSLRTWDASREVLDAAQERGLAVTLGLRMGVKRHGFDYGDREQVEKQLARIREEVAAHKDHPALLMWGIGNELELHLDSKEERIAIWQAVDEVAVAIREIDPNHPRLAIVAGLGEANAAEIREHAPNVDALGVNVYGRIGWVPEALAGQGWTKPWLLTEFGPVGHWQSTRTSWGQYIEPTSTEKEDTYLDSWRSAVASQPSCLGGYFFLWGHKQEKTHTWYGILLPPNLETLSPADAMAMAWTGTWPANRAPRIEGRVVARKEGAAEPPPEAIFAPGERIVCTVDVADPDADDLRMVWEIRPDVSDNPATGGDRENAVDPLAEAILATEGGSATIRVPEREGPWRVFVYALDGKGSAATANLPILVRGAATGK